MVARGCPPRRRFAACEPPSKLRVEFFPEALDELEARRRWWRENRDEQQLFDDESLEERAPTFPVFAVLGQRRVYRILIPKTRCRLYFEIAGDLVMVVPAWGATRERTPRL
jgi:hypothetical protein